MQAKRKSLDTESLPPPTGYVSRRKVNPKNRKPFLIAVIAIGSGFLIALLLIKLPWLHIAKIVIQNNGGDDALVADIQALKGQNVLFLKTDRIATGLRKKYPTTQQIIIKKVFPNTLMATVNQRVPVAIIRFALLDPSATQSATAAANRSTVLAPPYFMDKYAIIYQAVPISAIEATQSSPAAWQIDQSLPIITYESATPGKIGANLAGQTMTTLLTLLPAADQKHVALHNLRVTNYGISAQLSEPITVFFAKDVDVFWQLTALQTILDSTKIERKKLATIDLRYEKPTVTYR